MSDTAKAIIGILILVVLLLFNPGIEAHKEALSPALDKSMNEAYRKGGFLDKVGLALFGGAVKGLAIESLGRKSYGIFSLGYIDEHLVSIGILGCLFVVDED